MTAVARMSPTWARRMGFVATVFAAFALWCLVDASIRYPRLNARAAEYNRLLAAGEADAWPVRAADKGWNPDFGAEDRRADGSITLKMAWDIGTQYLMMAAALAVTAVALIRVLRARRRTMRADDGGFLTCEGVRVPYPEITEIDLRRWQRKSIAMVRFRRGNRLLTTVIDDWVYRGGEDVLAELQRRTGRAAPDAPAPPTAAADANDRAGKPNALTCDRRGPEAP